MKITLGNLKRVIRESIVTDNVFVESTAIEQLRAIAEQLDAIRRQLRVAISSDAVGDDEANKYTETSREGVDDAKSCVRDALTNVDAALSALQI